MTHVTEMFAPCWQFRRRCLCGFAADDTSYRWYSCFQ